MLVAVSFLIRLTPLSLILTKKNVEIRLASYKNWHKTTDKLNRVEDGKIGKPKYSNVKIHLLAILLINIF